MIVHSVMPIDALLPQPQPPKLTVIPWNGGFLEGSVADGMITVSRLESTNPADYLNGALMPGSVVPVSDRFFSH